MQLTFAESRPSIKNLKNELLRMVDQKNQLLIEVSDALWEYAEIALLEYESSKLLIQALEKEGFDVERKVAGMPTAFVASYGSGKPIIGILAEYDALPGLSQDSTPYKKARIEGGAGHGCGHNLFGAGSLGAAFALKGLMEENKIPGTIKLYGCPAEEDIGGKLFMARDGLFDDLDACIAWHPSYETKVDVQGSQAIDDMEIEFFGKTAHAAFDPWKGASALDAVEMTTFGINLLREHVKPSVRIHYVITQGGEVPNIVPEYAKLWLWVRDSTRLGVKTDVAEVSWITPTLNLSTTCAPYGIPWHSWAVVASSRHSIGYKGMLLAAKVMATTALDLFLDQEILIEMKKEFKDKLKGYTYKSGIPPDKKPPIRIKKKSAI